MTAPLTDETLREYATCREIGGGDLERMARELLAARGELTRWRSIGVDMVHGAMLAVAGVSLDENQAERIKLREERDDLRESLRAKEGEVADLLQQRAQGNGWDSDEWYGELCRVEAVLNAVGGMEISRPCSDLVGAVICQRDAARRERDEARESLRAKEAEPTFIVHEGPPMEVPPEWEQGYEAGMMRAQAMIVAWLRVEGSNYGLSYADAIERGDYRKKNQ